MIPNLFLFLSLFLLCLDYKNDEQGGDLEYDGKATVGNQLLGQAHHVNARDALSTQAASFVDRLVGGSQIGARWIDSFVP